MIALIVGGLIAVVVAWALARGGKPLEALAARVPSLGVHGVALGLANLAAVALFVQVAGTTSISSESDVTLRDAVHTAATPVLDGIANVLTYLADTQSLLVACLVFIVVTWERRTAVVLTSVAVSEEAIAWLLKITFQRARPTLWDGSAIPSFSFPSRHSMAAMAIYGTMALILTRFYPRARASIVASAVVLTVAIGMSRVYLGFHWPTDVLGGFAAGAFLLGAGGMALGPTKARA